jgi:hypothetical protein
VPPRPPRQDDAFREPSNAASAGAASAGTAEGIRLACWKQMQPLLRRGMAEPQTRQDVPSTQIMWSGVILIALLAVLSLSLFAGWGASLGELLFWLPVLVAVLGMLCVVLLAYQQGQSRPVALLAYDEATFLDRLAEQYGLAWRRLNDTSLPLTVIDEGLWEQFLAGIPARLRELLLGHPPGFGARLVQAAALWEMLVGYNDGRPSYSALAVLECSGRIGFLRSLPQDAAAAGWRAVSAHTDVFARFAAVYDYFLAPGELADGAEPEPPAAGEDGGAGHWSSH